MDMMDSTMPTIMTLHRNKERHEDLSRKAENMRTKRTDSPSGNRVHSVADLVRHRQRDQQSVTVARHCAHVKSRETQGSVEARLRQRFCLLSRLTCVEALDDAQTHGGRQPRGLH